eukprot:TRINITY_DN22374_c0_g1_i1.p1 TRINITY_DN22374_c0_g1~~TRINITY_DN22374_c0_g1_i1.p1  ORF type:complete len:232 (-),score=46.40 TRINITY_DN22374_c0_g1_i1:226-921(-)
MESTKVVSVKFPPVSNLKVIETLDLGSSKPLKVKDKKTGHYYVLKKGTSKEQVATEVCVNEAYRIAGILVPHCQLTDDGQLLAQWIKGKTWRQFKANRDMKDIQLVRSKIKQGFVMDCLVGNWDVIGYDEDNIIIDKNKDPWRVDNGGSLFFRARGEKKTSEQWNSHVGEIYTMRSGRQAHVFGDITNSEICQQTYLLLDCIKDIVAVLPLEARDIVQERFNFLLELCQSF